MWTIDKDDDYFVREFKDVISTRTKVQLRGVLTSALELPSWATKEDIAKKITELL